MNFLFTLNSSYLEPLRICLYSISKVSDEPNDYYIAHSTLNDFDMGKIKMDLSGTCHKVHFITIGAEYFNGLTLLKHTSKETYYRLLCTDFLPESIDRILYLDPDIICINSINELYYMDLKDNFFAMASHTNTFFTVFNKFRLHLPKIYPYYNAGVMLINLKLLRKFYCGKDILNFMTSTKIHLEFADQDVLNLMFYDRITQLDTIKYNLDLKQLNRFKLSPSWARHNAAIIHFDGRDKPWKPGCKNVLKMFYEELCNDKENGKVYKGQQADSTADRLFGAADTDHNLLLKIQ